MNRKFLVLYGIMWVVIFGAIFIGLLTKANAETEELFAISDCIDERSKAEGFRGDAKQAWEAYYEICQ